MYIYTLHKHTEWGDDVIVMSSFTEFPQLREEGGERGAEVRVAMPTRLGNLLIGL